VGQVEQCDIIPLIVEGAELLQVVVCLEFSRGMFDGVGWVLVNGESFRTSGVKRKKYRKCAKLMLTDIKN
jgi:hypothetical protein